MAGELELMRDIGRLLAEAAREQARQNLLVLAQDSNRARAIRNDLDIIFLSESEEAVDLAVQTEFYWALYYHDGRGPISFEAKPGRFMVFYADPKEDPRTVGGTDYPRRVSDVRPLRLGKGEFRRLLDSGRLIAVKRVGPADPHPFFEVGMRNASRRASQAILSAFGAFVRRQLEDDDLLNPPIDVAVFEL